METISQTNYIKQLYNQNGICLKKDTLDETYTLNLCINNKNVSIDQIYNFNLYRLLYELNKDILELVEIKNETENSCDVLLVFKQFGLEFGIPQKYMILTNNKKKINNAKINYKGDDNNSNIFNVDHSYEKITVHKSDLNIIEASSGNYLITYEFNIDIHENLPQFMENIIGTLIKNIFIRFKYFIENYK